MRLTGLAHTFFSSTLGATLCGLAALGCAVTLDVGLAAVVATVRAAAALPERTVAAVAAVAAGLRP